MLSDAYVEMGGPEFDEEDYAIARKFLAILPEDAKKAMVQKMAVLHKMTPEEFEKRPLNSVVIPYSPLMRQKVLTASSDVGDVSYLVPTAQLTASAAIPGTGHHTWQYTAQVGTSIGGKACLAAAKAIGLACTRIISAIPIIVNLTCFLSKKPTLHKSSWGAVLVSFLKEFLLNSFEAPGHLYLDNLHTYYKNNIAFTHYNGNYFCP